MGLLGGALMLLGAAAFVFGSEDVAGKGFLVGAVGLGVLFFDWLLGD